MPTYNEEANIEDIVLLWYLLLNGKSEKSRIVVANSGSTDKTYFILRKLKREYRRIIIPLIKSFGSAKLHLHHGISERDRKAGGSSLLDKKNSSSRKERKKAVSAGPIIG